MTKQPKQETSEKPSFYDIDRPCHRLIPFFFVGVSVLLGFFLYTSASGVLGAFVQRVLLGCFSFFAYAIPPLVLLHGIFWRYEIVKRRAISHGVYALAFLLMANALWFTFTPAASDLASVKLGAYYGMAQSLTAPGMLGVMVGYALRFLTGVVGAPLVSAMLVILFLYQFIGVTPKSLLARAKKEASAVGEDDIDSDPLYTEDATEEVTEVTAPAPQERKAPEMTLKEKQAERKAKRAAARAEALAAKEARRAEKAARKNPVAPPIEGYYPETDETFDEIRARLTAEERRYQRAEKKKKGAPSARRQETTPAMPHRSRVGVDVPLDPRPTILPHRPVETPSVEPTPQAGIVTPVADTRPVGGTTDGESADAIFSRFDPLAGDSLISQGSPVWRSSDSSLIYDDTKPAPQPTHTPIDKSKIHTTEGGVVSESGGRGSFRIEAQHMDIPSSRDRYPRPTRRPVTAVTPAQDEGYTTDISDILAGIEAEEGATTSTTPGMPTPQPLPVEEPVATVDETPTPNLPSPEELPEEPPIEEPVPVNPTPSSPEGKAEEEKSGQDYVFEPYVPPVTNDVPETPKAKERKRGPDYTLYTYPPISLLDNSRVASNNQSEAEINDMIERLVREFRKFKIEIKVHAVTVGPRITRYSISPPDGTRISAIMNLSNDIALGLAVKSIRIEPVPGTPYLGIEIPNERPTSVPLASLINTDAFRNSKTVTTVALGASVTGQPVLADLGKMPHVLVAGATGMGKSVFLNSVLISLLYRARPDEVKLILIDPKRVELSVYSGIPHLLIPPVIEAQKAAGALIWAVGEMERRYNLMTEVGVRSIEGYNEAVKRDPSKGEPQPKIIIAIDELNDLMMQARDAVEPAIMSIAQKARAAGIHLILCTQRPSVDVITGVIKANIPSRIALHVSSGTDSRTILDFYGAEKLLDKGDMLAAIAGAEPIRVQSAFVSDDEVENVTSFLKRNAGGNVYDDIIASQIDAETEKYRNSGKRAEKGGADEECADASIFEDSKFIEVCHVAFNNGKVSTSLLQRNCGLGYGRAAKYIDIMQSMGIVSPPDGTKPRDVLMTRDQFMEMVAREAASGD